MEFKSQPWYQFLDEGMRDLIKQAYSLLMLFSSPSSPSSLDSQPKTHNPQPFHDYSFIVFPMAKAYEGFLKKWFFTNGFINEYQYRGDHFRIGKALNPSLPARFKSDGYVYDQIVASCPDPHLADQLWLAWKQSRNLTFHYFPHHRYFLTLSETRARLAQLASAMKSAIACHLG